MTEYLDELVEYGCNPLTEFNTLNDPSVHCWPNTSPTICPESNQTDCTGLLSGMYIYEPRQSHCGHWHWECAGWTNRQLDALHYEGNLKEEVVENIRIFGVKKEQYYRHGLNHRLQILLQGPSGCGKMSLVYGVANHFNRNIYILNLEDYESSEDVEHAMEHLMYNVPSGSILVIPNAETNDVLSYTFLINSRKLYLNPDIVVFMIYNDFTEVDQGLIGTGMIDYEYELGYVTKRQLRKMYRRYYPTQMGYFGHFYDRFRDISIPVTPSELSSFFFDNIDCIDTRDLNLERLEDSSRFGAEKEELEDFVRKPSIQESQQGTKRSRDDSEFDSNSTDVEEFEPSSKRQRTEDVTDREDSEERWFC